MKKILLSVLVLASLTSCEKIIDLDLNSSQSQLVIQGEIVQDQFAEVTLDKTVNFNESNVLPVVQNATVNIQSGSGETEKLIETKPGVYVSTKMKGKIGETYTLSVVAEGKTYTAKSTMPKPVLLTSVKYSPATFAPPGAAATGFTIFPQFFDPQVIGNNYRFIQSKNGERDNAIIVVNDNAGNGQPNSRPLLSRTFSVVVGDVYTLEMQCLDKPVYDFFYSRLSIENNGPGGGTTPADPITNINGGALGYFSAHTSQKVTVEIK